MESCLLFCPPLLISFSWAGCDSSRDLGRICCGNEMILWCTSWLNSWTLLIYRNGEIPWKLNSEISHTWEFYGLLQVLKVFGSPGCGNIWPEGVVHSVMSLHLLCCVRQKCSEEFLMDTGSSHVSRKLWRVREGQCRGGACVPFLWVILRENPWRQEGIGENDEYGECLMCLLPASVLCIVLLGIFSICSSLNLFQGWKILKNNVMEKVLPCIP